MTGTLPVNLQADHTYKMLHTRGKVLGSKERTRARLAIPYADLARNRKTRRFRVNCSGFLPVVMYQSVKSDDGGLILTLIKDEGGNKQAIFNVDYTYMGEGALEDFVMFLSDKDISDHQETSMFAAMTSPSVKPPLHTTSKVRVDLVPGKVRGLNFIKIKTKRKQKRAIHSSVCGSSTGRILTSNMDAEVVDKPETNTPKKMPVKYNRSTGKTTSQKKMARVWPTDNPSKKPYFCAAEAHGKAENVGGSHHSDTASERSQGKGNIYTEDRPLPTMEELNAELTSLKYDDPDLKMKIKKIRSLKIKLQASCA